MHKHSSYLQKMTGFVLSMKKILKDCWRAYFEVLPAGGTALQLCWEDDLLGCFCWWNKGCFVRSDVYCSGSKQVQDFVIKISLKSSVRSWSVLVLRRSALFSLQLLCVSNEKLRIGRWRTMFSAELFANFVLLFSFCFKPAQCLSKSDIFT